MRDDARIQSAIDLVQNILDDARPADNVVRFFFKNNRYIGAKDRRHVRDIAYACMRYYFRLTWWCETLSLPVDARSFVLLYLVFLEKRDKKKLEALFSSIHYGPEGLSAQEMEAALSIMGQDIIHKDMPIANQLETPASLLPAIEKSFGDTWQDEMRAMLDNAKFDMRVNTIKIDRDTAIKKFTDDGIEVEAGKYSPYCIRMAKRFHLAEHDFLNEGKIEVQDQASQMVALLTGAKPGLRIIDFCAGAGGKTLAIGMLMDNKGSVVATDISDGRLKRAKQRIRRAGLHNIETKLLEHAREKWVKRRKETFDVVLIDAPCTGTGTWRRDPDKKWRDIDLALTELVPLQADILDSASRLVKPGGRLVYATCSFLDSENGDQIRKFMETHPDFTWGEMPEEVKDLTDDSELKMTPYQHDTDGFYAAVLTRKEK